MSPPAISDSSTQQQHTTTRRGLLGKAAVLGSAAVASGCLGSRPSTSETQQVVDLPASVARTRFARSRDTDRFDLRYHWYNGREWRVDFEVPVGLYEDRVSASRSLSAIIDDAVDSEVSRTLASRIAAALDEAGVRNPLNRVRVVTSFVRALRYVRDEDTTESKEYPRFVAETLVENKGDCEDFAAIFAGVFAAPPFDADPKFVVLPGHTGIGLSLDALGLDGDDHGGSQASSDDASGVLPTLSVDDEELLYVDPTYPVGLGVVPEPYREYNVVATYDDGWRVHDPQAFGVHVRQSVIGEGISDPSKYF